MKFQYFTYFLNPISQQSLFLDNKNKNEILKEIISKKIEFKNGKINLVYLCNKSFDNFVFAKFGKQSQIKKNLLSDNDFKEIKETSYPYCYIIFNLSEDSNFGQKIAFQYDSSIFKSPEKQLKLFENKINEELFSRGYAMSINPVVDKKEFWDLAKQYEGKIEKVTFSYAIPNLFKLQESLSDDLKAVGELYSGTGVSVSVENKDGGIIVPKNEPFVDQSVEYTSRGGGEYKFKIKGISSEISSGKNVKTMNVEEMELSTDDPEVLKRCLDNLFKF